MKKKVYKLSGMHCTSCSMLIEGELEDEVGVKAMCNWIKQLVEVEFDPRAINERKIKEIIEEQGYRVVGED